MKMTEIKARIDAVPTGTDNTRGMSLQAVAKLMREAYQEGQRDALALAARTSALEEFERGEQSGRANLQAQLRELLGLTGELDFLHNTIKLHARAIDELDERIINLERNA